MTEAEVRPARPDGQRRTGAPLWGVVAEQELRGLWVGGRALPLMLAYTVVLSLTSYLVATNQALNFLEVRESVSLTLGVAVAVSALLVVLGCADAISGERDRGTLGTLLLSPTSGRALIAGKALAAMSLWLAALVLAVPYVWFLGRGVGRERAATWCDRCRQANLLVSATSRSPQLVIRLDRDSMSVSLGDRFSFTSTVRNVSGAPRSGLIAHLNVLSTNPATYVDPEDWSTARSQFLTALSTHGSQTLSWPMQAVTSGPIVLYVAVTDTRTRTVTVSAPVLLTVETRRTLNAEGIVPLAVGLPTVVAALLVAVRIRRRRLRSQ